MLSNEFQSKKNALMSDLSEELRQSILTRPLKRVGQRGTFTAPYTDTGALAKSVSFIPANSGGKIVAFDYIYYGENGRAPGKFAPVNSIVSWTKRKSKSENKQLRGVAFAINRSIALRGTTIFRAGGKSGLISGVFTKDRLEKLREDLGAIFEVEFTSNVLKAFT